MTGRAILGRGRVVLAVAICALAFLGGIQAWAETLSPKEYGARTQEASTLVAQGRGPLCSEETGRLDELFPKDLRIRAAGGRGFLVDDEALRKWLDEAKGSEEGRIRLAARLEALAGQIVTPMPAGQAADGLGIAQRKALEEIYALPHFRHLREKRTPDWLEPLLDLFRSLLEWLVDLLQAVGSEELNWAQNIAYGVILILGIALIIWVVRAFGSAGWSKGPPRHRAAPLTAAKERGWVSWRQEADQRASLGEFREAIRCLFISVLHQGHQLGWWVYEPQATNREHLSRIPGPSERREAMGHLVDRYELSWYGLGQPDAREFQACEALRQRVEAAA